jgi:hypothetical protein
VRNSSFHQIVGSSGIRVQEWSVKECGLPFLANSKNALFTGDLLAYNNLDDVNIITFAAWTAPRSYIATLNTTSNTVIFTTPTLDSIADWDGKNGKTTKTSNVNQILLLQVLEVLQDKDSMWKTHWNCSTKPGNGTQTTTKDWCISLHMRVSIR